MTYFKKHARLKETGGKSQQEGTIGVSNYITKPVMHISDESGEVCVGVKEIASQIAISLAGFDRCIVTLECYPGADISTLVAGLLPLGFSMVIHSDDLALEPKKIDALLEVDMTEDRVFGIMSTRGLQDFFDDEKIEKARSEVAAQKNGLILIYGVGASLVHTGDLLVLADITRWELQLRYRKGQSSWRTAKENQPKLAKYKRGFFAEWRWADKIKKQCLAEIDFYLDTTNEDENKFAMVSGERYRRALLQLSARPFRMVPYFDPGVWGGNWMQEHFDLPENGSNYAWSFDGVPEENSLLLGFGERVIETPAMNLVLQQPKALLGERVYARFGAEFPIRFDLLDTVNGQNLSLQVHPLTDYIQENFNMRYTQDESYYILDTQGEDTHVWLGLRDNVNREAMEKDLYAAEKGGESFPAAKYINKIPVQRHDHVLIPAGTVHCSGANTMVLEISATPYIFTFKMWDWARTDLDGVPRPIHLEHAMKNIQWDRGEQWIKQNALHRESTEYRDDATIIERTGLHELEFIDTYRITTTARAKIKRNGSVHMLNLVEGDSAWIVSASDAFAPFEVHYAETFVVPEAAGEYEIAAPNGARVKVILAGVRE